MRTHSKQSKVLNELLTKTEGYVSLSKFKMNGEMSYQKINKHHFTDRSKQCNTEVLLSEYYHFKILIQKLLSAASKRSTFM